MKRIAIILSAIVMASSAFAERDDKAFELPSGAVIDKRGDKRLALPSDAVIIEEQALGSKKYPDRALILWMKNPARNPSRQPLAPGFPYTCPDQTRGSYYSGPARVSLLNTKTRTVINTIKIDGNEYEDSLDIPYAICKGYYYRVEGNAPESEEVKPHILWLRDYNGDGKALEFALFDKEACVGLATTLIGYSERRDRVIQYPIYLKVEDDDGRSTELSRWCDYLFTEEPTSPGRWKYEVDYRGRGGSLDKYEIRYDVQKEIFVGKSDRTEHERENR